MPSRLIRTDGPVDRHDETNSNLSQFCKIAQIQQELNPLSVYEGKSVGTAKLKGTTHNISEVLRTCNVQDTQCNSFHYCSLLQHLYS